MHYELFSVLDKDVVVVTANLRLSRYLQEQYAYYQIKSGRKAWLRPAILSLNTWISHCWQYCELTQDFLLSDFQEEVLWQKTLRLSHQTANLAKKAWQLIKAWNLSLRDCKQETNSEVECFIQWAYQFETELKKQKLISAVELPKQLETLISNLNLPQKIILIGFDELVPTIQQFFDALARKTVILYYSSRHHQKNYIKRLSFKEREAEIQTMARWAYNKRQINPAKKIGCIVPILTEHRSQIYRIFRNIFGSDKYFNISAGKPLAHISVVKTALKILTINPFHSLVTELSALFCSPYINSMGDNAYLAAMLDVKLRETKQWQSNSRLVLYYLDELQKKFPKSTFKIRYQRWMSLERSTGNLPLSGWIENFIKELSVLGWPGQLSLNSKEYQQLKRWNEMLQEFAKLDVIISPQTRKHALQLLWHLGRKTIFQYQSAQNASIQILGLLETAGLEFDSLWIMGLDNKNWPPSPKPNPFLPINLQRRHRMPHSSFKRETNYALQIQKRLIDSASDVILSASLQDRDVQLSPSSLILDFPQGTIEELCLPVFETLSEQLFKGGSKCIEKIEDNQAPPLQEGELVKGGSEILQSQSDCPLQAFAKIRLRARPLKQAQIGLNSADRGNLIHHALDILWKKIKNWQTLANYSDTELETIVDNTVNELSTFFNSDSLFFCVEKKRIKYLIKRWLLLEANRPSFNVSQRETARFIKIGLLNLHVRIDRIDILNNGNFIIDYKTSGKNQVTDWLGNRLKNVQLPLYCTFGSHNIVGIAYAEVTSKKMNFKGWLIDKEKPFSNVGLSPLPWKGLLNNWKTILYQLAIDFSLGKAEVDPFNIKTTCKLCSLHSLCRVGEEDK